MPPRNPNRKISDKLIRKAGKKLGLSEEEAYHELDSLNSFLGWDVKEGLKASQK